MTNKKMGYDETKKLLNKLRSFQYPLKKTDLKEYVHISDDDVKSLRSWSSDPRVSDRDLNKQSNPPDQSTDKQYDDVTVINDVEVKILSADQEDLKVTEVQKESISQLIDNFKQQVSQIVDFDPGMTINEKQIRLDGRLSDADIGFVFISGDEAGTYLNLDMTKLDQNVSDTINKLLKFELTFKTAMDPLIPERTNT